jgi:acyl carrier protein
MEKEKVSSQILNMLIKQLRKNPADVKMESRIKEDLGADSLDVVEILMTVEDSFGITVDDEEIKTVKTVGDLIKMVDALADGAKKK